MKILSTHIVRRYGLVGGMENYVIELTHALAKQNQDVTVLCETYETHLEHPLIKVIVLGNPIKKPRWLAQWSFSREVSKYVNSNNLKNTVIHSHERSSNHQVTTFHGPPFLDRKKRFMDFLSPRIWMWTHLEKTELLGPQVKAVLPNSTLIAKQLETYYPSIKDKIREPAYPGVSDIYSNINKANNGLTIGFIGREWKRKGLDFACDIVRALQSEIPKLHFLIAGVDADEVKHLFIQFPKNSYTLVGWLDRPEDFLEKIDLLLHPARAEPFGMAILEANAAKIPVIISEHCGIASLITDKQGKVLSLKTHPFNLETWVETCSDLLMNTIKIEPLNLSWDALAKQHIELYRSLQ